MNITEHLLQCLQEECAKVIHIASKSNRFGLHDTNVLNPSGPNNKARLIAEINDFLAVLELCTENGILPAQYLDHAAIEAKKDKVMKFMLYASQRGALQERDYSHP